MSKEHGENCENCEEHKTRLNCIGDLKKKKCDSFNLLQVRYSFVLVLFTFVLMRMNLRIN